MLGENLDRGEPELAEVVGMPGARCKWAMLERDGYHLELFQWLTPAGSAVNIRQCDIGYTHIAFQVKDAREVHARLTASGYHPLNTTDLAARRPRNAFYCRGPEGCIIEFVEYPFGA